jgi:hypothetical protein
LFGLGQLAVGLRVFHGERMQAEAIGDHVQLLRARLDKADPDEFIADWRLAGVLVPQRDVADALAVAIAAGCNDAQSVTPRLSVPRRSVT